jgi:uncharacterized glyoxalase superfamily protein PhnB
MGSGNVRFDGLNLVASDLDRTIEFYRQLGLAISDDMVWRTESGAHHVSGIPTGSDLDLDLDSPQLAAAYNEGYGESPSATVIGFRLDTRGAVDELYDELVSAGHQGRQPPFDAFWGARYAIVADPDGRDIGLMSPSDPDRRARPPQV